MNKFKDEAIKIAELVSIKQDAYDSFGRSGEIIKVLYPDGIKPEQYKNALSVIRIIDKLFRIANKKDSFEENPWKDIAGYALLSIVKEGKN